MYTMCWQHIYMAHPLKLCKNGEANLIPHLAVMVLVGNKTDLVEQRTITEQEGQQLAERSVRLTTISLSV